jgi:hypothetical protein
VTLTAKKLLKPGRSIRPPHLRPQPRATPLQVSSLLLDAGLHPCLLLPIPAKTRALFRWQICPTPASTSTSSFPDRIWPRLVRLPISAADLPDADLHPHLLLPGLDLAGPSTSARRRWRPPSPTPDLSPSSSFVLYSLHTCMELGRRQPA